jgi:hypothetical protein
VLHDAEERVDEVGVVHGRGHLVDHVDGPRVRAIAEHQAHGGTRHHAPGGQGRAPLHLALAAGEEPAHGPLQVGRHGLVGGGGHQGDGRHPLAEHVGVVAAEAHDGHATHGVAHHHGVAQVEHLQQGGQVGGQAGQAQAEGAHLRPAVAAQVHRDHAVAVGELVELRGPHVVAEGDAVQQHQRAALALLGVVDGAAVGGGHVALHHAVGQVEQVVRQRSTATTRVGRDRTRGLDRVRGPVEAQRGGAGRRARGGEGEGLAGTAVHDAPFGAGRVTLPPGSSGARGG